MVIHLQTNMDTTCFACREKCNYLSFTRLGLRCYFMEIHSLMCASLWIITSVLGFLFSMEIGVSYRSITCGLSCLSSCSSTLHKKIEIMIKRLNICIILFNLIDLLQKTVSRNLFHYYEEMSWWYIVYS